MTGVREGFSLYYNSFVLLNHLDLLNQLLDELPKDGKKCVSMHIQDHSINWAPRGNFIYLHTSEIIMQTIPFAFIYIVKE